MPVSRMLVLRTSSSMTTLDHCCFEGRRRGRQRFQLIIVSSRRRRSTCCYARAAPAASRTTSLQLPHPSGCDINVFGVEHLTANATGADFILQSRPTAVVVETAVGPEHGAATGNELTIETATDDFFGNMFKQLGGRLAAEPAPLTSELWQNLKPHWAGEQLAYMAALAVGAPLIYGDEVKHDTFRRLAATATLADLDSAFGAQSWLNYAELLRGKASQPLDVDSMGVVDRIMLTDREAVLCSSLNRAAEAGHKGVVGIFGESHLPGIEQLWADGSWKSRINSNGDASSSTTGSSESASTTVASASMHFSEAEQSDTTAEGAAVLNPNEAVGVRRALLESVIRLKSVPITGIIAREEEVARPSVSAGVVDDLRRALGDLPDEAWEPYCWAHELYASPRMLLACLTRQQLAEVCSGLGCDMWSVLQPIRDVRPVNGGSGLDIDLAVSLRALDLDFS